MPVYAADGFAPLAIPRLRRWFRARRRRSDPESWPHKLLLCDPVWLVIADWIFVPPGLALMPSIDFDHPNSLEIDGQGNYVVSFGWLGEITKIDGVTGQILWRFGGRNNQFTIVGDPLGGFGIQHDVRLLSNGNLLF